jgi:hypothetical protein
MTQEEIDIINTPAPQVLITNVLIKPLVVQIAEATYTTLYARAFASDPTGYTNASFLALAASLSSYIVATNQTIDDIIFKQNITICKEYFSIIETWWLDPDMDEVHDRYSFHPYPWGLNAITNVNSN